MSKQDTISQRVVAYQVDGVDDVIVHQDIAFHINEDGPQTMDIYYPPGSNREQRKPAVVFVFGYPDPVMEAMIGSKLKRMGQYKSWGRLAAASGLVAITYETKDPLVDIQRLFSHIMANAASLGIDQNRIGIWSCSGNVPMAVSILMDEIGGHLKYAVLYYGFMLDPKGCNYVTEAAESVGFVNASSGRSFDEVPLNIPMLIVRAGQDNPKLNETIDHFLGKAVVNNMPVQFINYAAGQHAFDIYDESEISREIIKQTLAFMCFHIQV